MPYNIATIRELLRDTFTDTDLRRFCRDRPPFREVLDITSSNASLADLVEALIEYSEKRVLLEELLSGVEEYSPRQYERYREQIELTTEDGSERLSAKKLLLEEIPSDACFIGREDMLSTYREKLQGEHLVIIKGMAGVGKTSLGARLAREEAEAEEQIFWFTFNQMGKKTAESLFWALAAFLDNHGNSDLWRYLQGEIDSQKPLETTVKLNLLLSSLSSGSYLLCFDDFQEVKEAPDIIHFFTLVQRRFRGRPQDLPTRFIIMGREIPLEMEYLVQEPLGGFTEGETGILIEEQNLPLPSDLIRELWKRTEGNPKLLNLAISALAGMGGDQAKMRKFIGDMVKRRGDVRDYLMNEIYRTLQPEERQVASILSIFPTPVEQDKVGGVLYAEGITGIASHIDALINKSIVSETDDLRIHCHSLVREYLYEMMDGRDRGRYHQKAAINYEQADDYLAAAYHYFQQGARGDALDLLTIHSRDIIQGGKAGELLEQLAWFQRSGLNSQQWLALSRAKGDAHEMRGEYDQAVAAFEAALEEADEEKAEADLLRKIGTAYHLLGDYDTAIERFLRSFELSESTGDRAGKAGAHHNLGWAFYRQRKIAEARDQFAACRELARELDDALLMAKVDLGLGLLDWRDGQLDKARARFESSQRVFGRFGDRRRESMAITNLGLIYGQLGDLARERDYNQEALGIQEEMGDVHGRCITYNNLGNVHHLLGDHRQAVQYYEKLADLAAKIEHKPMLSTACAGLADGWLALGNSLQALEHAQDAQRIALDAGSEVDLGVSYRVLGEVWLALEDPARAQACFEQGIPLLEEANEEEELAKARDELERARSRLGGDSP